MDALAAGDLNQALAGKIGVVVNLRLRRREQNAGVVLVRQREVRDLLADFGEHLGQQVAGSGWSISETMRRLSQRSPLEIASMTWRPLKLPISPCRQIRLPSFTPVCIRL